MKGYILDVYRHKGHDCTNGGVSANHDTLMLVGEGVPEIFEADGKLPIVTIKTRGTHRYLAPVEVPAGCTGPVVGPMFGGNFGYHSDSRISALLGGHPLPIHDRFETEDEYRRLSI